MIRSYELNSRVKHYSNAVMKQCSKAARNYFLNLVSLEECMLQRRGDGRGTPLQVFTHVFALQGMVFEPF